MPAYTKQPKVALLIETSNSYARGLLRGITAYVREHRPWSIYLPELGRGEAPPSWLNKWEGDGIIARIENENIAKVLKKKSIPIVDVSTVRLLPKLAYVETDDQDIAHQAAKHYIDRGFKNLAFCGERNFKWSALREQHFQGYLQQQNLNCGVHITSTTNELEWETELERLKEWLIALPKPVGIFTCYDILGRTVLDVCRSLELAVPEEVAVLGVDNDELICDLATPPLSSVIPNTRKSGYLAAEILDQLMSGKPLENDTHLIKSLGIATRQSTDMLAIDDRDVAVALQFIREQACQGIQVGDILKVIPLSRRILESRFRKALGRTPHEEITRIRIQRVKELLTETDLSVEKIALKTGFEHPEYLTVAFKRQEGVPPSHYRKVTQTGNDGNAF
jgi:LacI family transcriptional regulator